MVARALVALPFAVQTVQAADVNSSNPYDVAYYCLVARGSDGDDAAPLRLAGVPMVMQSPGVAFAQGTYPMFRPGAAASGVALDSLPNFFGGGQASPVIQPLLEGSSDLVAGRHAAAERGLVACAKAASGASNSLLEAACTNNLALAHAIQGKFTQARAELERTLHLYRSPRDVPADLPASFMNPMVTGLAQLPGGVLDRLMPSLKPKLQEAATNAWRQAERVDARRGIERTMLNLGNLDFVAGRMADAERSIKGALDSHAADESRVCKVAAANDLARVYRRLGRQAEAQALRTARAPGAKSGGREVDGDISMVELGAVYLAAAGTGQASGRGEPTSPQVIAATTDGRSARKFTALGEATGRFDDGSLSQLLASASRDATSLPPARATAAWQRLALRASSGRRPDIEFTAHATLMNLFAAQGQPNTAVFHGKQAANVAQATRSALNDRSPSRDSRRSFLRDRRKVYVALAQLLLDQNRLAEAESALQLLNEDEGRQFAEEGSGASLGTLSLSSSEQTQQRQVDDAVLQLRQAEEARVAAVAKMPLGAGALLMVETGQIEKMRLQLGLALPGLADPVRRTPLRGPADSPLFQGMLADLRDFFVGPGMRAEKFLDHLIEDAPQFDPPASPQERAQLADAKKRLPRALADLAPLLNNVPDGPAVTVTTRRVGEPRSEDVNLTWYIGAEPTERVWRSIRTADLVEVRYLQGRAVATLDAAAEMPDAVAAVRDDTRALLDAQPVKTALLYYLPGEDRLDALLVSSTGRRHFRLAVPRATLNAEIDSFVKLLRQPERDPRVAAHAMYQRLFAPLEQAVESTGARVLALSLADRLRFVPFAALRSEQGWLVERYAMVRHPGGQLAGQLKPASPNWRVAALGVTLGSGEFPPLASVRSEIAAVVRQGGAASGALPGEAWLDKSFTAERLRTAIGSGAQVLHIASHFKFVGGDAAASYLLLGDGSRLSLRELAGPQYRFDRTELVTLSACATGLSADDLYGQEVDGLAALLMGQGAPSVLASLWEVNDLSTATLMSALYRLREGQKLSRALALQQAQLAMIRAALAASGADAGTRGVSRVRLPGDPEPQPGVDSAFAPPAALGQAHPFHWAAFVLMGNWL